MTRTQLCVSTALFSAAWTLGLAAPAAAQDTPPPAPANQNTAAQDAAAQSSETATSPTDIIVTAQRVEQRLQDVPISITVYNQQQLENRNVSLATDLATYTPSLSVNQRYGPEKASFSIRGFNQDQSTAPTVGVYFADVVGVRAQGGTTSGNTVGAGSFTDLQNVQVLKGPQGTLFGRNTTGGAVLLVPQKPTDRLEGYLEGSAGDYNMWRVQGALNVPLSDTFKLRFSVDRNKRDGYMINHSGIGPKSYNDLNYTYMRLSVVGDLTPNLENYIIATYSQSHTHGYAARLLGCNPTITAASGLLYATSHAACDQIARQNARGDGPLDVEVDNPDPFLRIDTWQVIDTTTWKASDTLTVKNIASYGEFREHTSFSLNSDNFFVPAPFPNTGKPFQYILLDLAPGMGNSSESTVTEELQLQGRTDKAEWVVGGYLEWSRPIGWSAGRTSIYGYCTDTENLVCQQPLGVGIISASATKISFNNHGIFGQGTYHFTDQLALTVGARYTFDKITGYSQSSRLTLIPNAAAPGGYITILACNDARANGGRPPATAADCFVGTGSTFANGQAIKQPQSNRPTWLVNLEYKPTPDLMAYAKYARGYRQGGLNFTNPGLETWEPEKVDAYELGLKTTFRGSVRGYFNVAAFYNKFSNQQVFGQLIAKPSSGLAGGAAIINAGRSRIYGLEVDSSATFFDQLRLDVGYTYLNARIQQLITPTLDPSSPFAQIIPNGKAGDVLALSPKHKLAVTGTYTLPLDKSIGEVSLGATYTYTSRQIVTTAETATATPVLGFDPGVLQPMHLVNLNLNWNNVAGMPVDFAAFVTNVTNRHYRVNIGQSWNSAGFENALYLAPRMWGVRLKYRFGT
ncbi:MAG: TonB-dependent receptor [Novosphingobium sp.]|nr:TonB-dependent receptor [Novosphingobium sp.]